MPEEEAIQEVPKVWGRERWLVNRAEYCAKLLYLDACAVSSLHRHLKKTETFYALENRCTLWVEGQLYDMNPQASPVTILPGQWHEFTGPTSGVARILEVSTHHDDADVERKRMSLAGLRPIDYGMTAEAEWMRAEWVMIVWPSRGVR